MNMSEYQTRAATFAQYDDPFYPWASLMVESAEAADIPLKPLLRGDDKDPYPDQLLGELGDVLWNLAMCAKEAGWSLEDVAEYNLKKLEDRQNRGVIRGDGDER